jgi:hypothetical protein
MIPIRFTNDISKKYMGSEASEDKELHRSPSAGEVSPKKQSSKFTGPMGDTYSHNLEDMYSSNVSSLFLDSGRDIGKIASRDDLHKMKEPHSPTHRKVSRRSQHFKALSLKSIVEEENKWEESEYSDNQEEDAKSSLPLNNVKRNGGVSRTSEIQFKPETKADKEKKTLRFKSSIMMASLNQSNFLNEDEPAKRKLSASKCLTRKYSVSAYGILKNMKTMKKSRTTKEKYITEQINMNNKLEIKKKRVIYNNI